jgi:hypothetical protein
LNFEHDAAAGLRDYPPRLFSSFRQPFNLLETTTMENFDVISTYCVIYKQGFNDKVFELLENFPWNHSSKLGSPVYKCTSKLKMQAWSAVAVASQDPHLENGFAASSSLGLKD